MSEISTGTAISYSQTGIIDAAVDSLRINAGIILSAPGHMVHGKATQSCTGHTEGTIILVFQTASAGIATSGVFVVQNTTGARKLEARVRGGANDDFFFQMEEGSNNCQVFCADTTVNDGEPHIVVIRQKADGTGVEVFIDGTIDKVTSISTAGTYTSDSWFEDVFGVLTSGDNTYVGSLYGASNKFDGYIGAVAATDVAISDANLSLLMEESGLADNFASKTIRRTGRRLFSPNI